MVLIVEAPLIHWVTAVALLALILVAFRVMEPMIHTRDNVREQNSGYPQWTHGDEELQRYYDERIRSYGSPLHSSTQNCTRHQWVTKSIGEKQYKSCTKCPKREWEDND